MIRVERRAVYLVRVVLIILIVFFKHDKAQSEIGDDQKANALLTRGRLLLLWLRFYFLCNVQVYICGSCRLKLAYREPRELVLTMKILIFHSARRLNNQANNWREVQRPFGMTETHHSKILGSSHILMNLRLNPDTKTQSKNNNNKDCEITFMNPIWIGINKPLGCLLYSKHFSYL